MRTFFTTLLLLVVQFCMAQFQVGHTTITFNDSLRSGGFGSGGGPGRQIQSEIYYPAAIAGEDVPVTSGTFAVVVFGHGFVMAWDAYQNVWEELVPEGYIVVFPRTEGNFSPDHNEFALDLALCVNAMQNENVDAGSLFNNSVDASSAIMGHSMGGGATILAAQNNTTIQAIIGLAPAETNPSAIGVANQVQVPALIMSGSSDGVTPPADHHIPIYNGITTCKYFVSVTGGAHCYFANTNFNCDFGEATASTGISVTRADQQQVMNDYMVDWLDYTLKGDVGAFTDFENLLTTDSRITYMDSCSVQVGIDDAGYTGPITVYPNPGNGLFELSGFTNGQWQVFDQLGQVVQSGGSSHIDLQGKAPGVYFLKLQMASGTYTQQLMLH